MSSGPSTLGIMTTSSTCPASLTAVTMSSSPQGESRALTRVHSWVSGESHARATSTRPARAASLSAAGTPSSRLASSTSTVGAIWGTFPTILGLEAGKKWIIRDGRKGISRNGSGAPTASGRKKSFGDRIATPYGRARQSAQRGSADRCDAAAEIEGPATAGDVPRRVDGLDRPGDGHHLDVEELRVEDGPQLGGPGAAVGRRHGQLPLYTRGGDRGAGDPRVVRDRGEQLRGLRGRAPSLDDGGPDLALAAP